MIPRVQRQLRIQDATLYRKLFKEEFDTITPINVIDEDKAFSLYELEFEDDIGQQEFVGLRRPPNKS